MRVYLAAWLILVSIPAMLGKHQPAEEVSGLVVAVDLRAP